MAPMQQALPISTSLATQVDCIYRDGYSLSSEPSILPAESQRVFQPMREQRFYTRRDQRFSGGWPWIANPAHEIFPNPGP